MNEIEVKKCPSCGGEMEHGFIHAPRVIYWDIKEQRARKYKLIDFQPKFENSHKIRLIREIKCTES